MKETQGVTTRTEQRRLLRTTGLTRGAIHQIERARQATRLLRQGRAILDVVHAAGYYDQAHLTRSLQRFVGQSPASVAQGREQLSLYTIRRLVLREPRLVRWILLRE